MDELRGWDRVNVFENLGKAVALPALPLITPLYDINILQNQLPKCELETASYFRTNSMSFLLK